MDSRRLSPLPADRRALKECRQNENITVFSDDIRDAIKGHYSNAADRGFATGKPGNEETVKIGIVAATAPASRLLQGQQLKSSPCRSTPTEIINYVSCHDRPHGSSQKSMPGSTEAERQRRRLAQTIVFRLGTPFIFARAKKYSRDRRRSGS